MGSPLFSFVREVFFSKEAIQQTIKRNKLVTLLIFSHTLFFLLLLFRTEQAIKREEKYLKLSQDYDTLVISTKPAMGFKEEYDRMVHELADTKNSLAFLQSDYTELNRTLSNCLSDTRKVCTVKKSKKPKQAKPVNNTGSYANKLTNELNN